MKFEFGRRGRWHVAALGGLIPLIAFIALLIQQIGALQYDVTVTELRRHTVNAAGALERYLSYQSGQLATLAHSPLLDDGDLERFHVMMTRTQAGHPEWIAFILSDAERQILNAKVPLRAALPELRDPKSLRAVFDTGEPQIGNLVRNGVALREPLMQDGEVRFVLTAVIDAAALNAVLAGELVPQGWRVQVFDGNKTVIARNLDPERNVGTTVPEHYDRALAAADETFRIVTRDGQDAFAAVVPVRGTGWRVAVTAPVAAVAAPYRNLERILYAAASVVAAAAVAILLLIFGRWNREARVLAARAEAAETGSREKSAFLANMSHEMRTPLNAVIGFAEMLENKAFGPLGHPKNAEYARDIAISGRHLLSLINDLLDLSKVEAGKMEVGRARVALAETVQKALSFVRESAGQADVTVISTVAPGIQVVADPRMLMQMLVNLVSNAVKYAPASKVTVSARRERDGVAIVVRDTGSGMSEDELYHALDPYSRGKSDVARRQPGTGLGLALTKRFAELHGGSLTLESAPGAGTVATIKLPHYPVVAGKDGNLGIAA